jgi:hypothetical protein
MPDQWKEPIIVPIYKKGDKTDCSKLSWDITAINFMQNFILQPSLKVKSIYMHTQNYGGSSYHQCGFQSNISTTDQIVCICQILDKKWKYNEIVHQLLTDFKKAYHSVRRVALYNTFI